MNQLRNGLVAGCAALSLAIIPVVAGCSSGAEEGGEKARLASGEVDSTSAASEAVAVEGTPLPEFRLASLAGEEVSPHDYADQVVLIDFWATWCGPCHAQADILHELWTEFEGKGVQFLAISLGESDATVAEFIERNPYPYPVLVDPDDELSIELGIYVLPTVVVIDRDGTVVFREPGVSGEETLRRVLYEAGAEHPATTSS